MLNVRIFRQVLRSVDKINLKSIILQEADRKGLYNQHNLLSSSSMDHKFMDLPNPVKSPSDKKEYKVILLENGLAACLICDTSSPGDISSEDETEEASSDEQMSDESSDEEAVPKNFEQKMAAAGLCVHVGSFSDPREVPGMAHFLEHMVFMGSEKFPAENDFDAFIKKGGGSNNASTDTETTCFYFECLEKYLHAALDKFAQFFIKPLMKKNAMTREREAIESEFQMALPSDSSRKEQLLCSLANHDTPVNSFSWGNLITLRDRISDDKLYEAVHEFRKRHYSANRMTLAVQARLPLETLEKYVIECFSDVPNNKMPPDDFSSFIPTIFDTKTFTKFYFIKPTKDVSHLDLTWCLPPLIENYKTNPLRYFSHLLGDEGIGSLTSYLRKKLWAIGVTAGNEEGGMEFNSIYSFFSITIILTDEGLKHVTEIIQAVYSYLNMLKTIGPQEWLFNELKLISDTAFRFASEQSAVDTVEELSEAMQFYPTKDILTGSDLFYEYHEEDIKTVMNCLHPGKMNVMLWTKNIPNPYEFDKKEQWFGTEYTDIDISQDARDKWINAAENPRLKIPPPNPYISQDFSILPDADFHPEYPQKVINNPLIEMWYRKDQKFKLPIAYFRFYLISPIIQQSAANSTMLDLMLNLLLFAFAEEIYPAMCAGLSPSFLTQERGLVIKVSGYNDKLPILVENLAQYVSQLSDKIDADMFNVIKDKLKKGYHNKLLKPSKLAKEIRMNILLKQFYMSTEKYKALEAIDFALLIDFIGKYLKSLHIKCLVQGNISQKLAMETVAKCANHLEYSAIPKKDYPKFHVRQIPIGEHGICVEGLNKNDANSIVVNYYQMNRFSLRDSAIIDIVMQIIEEPIFDILRTKEQLGYHVEGSARNTFGVLGYMVTVNCQATMFTTAYVDKRIEEFLIHSQKLLKDIRKDEFQQIKEDLIKTKEIADVHLQEEVGRNWEEIITDDYVFNRDKLEIQEIRKISLKEVRDWWNRHNKYGTRENFRKVSIQVIGHDNKDNQEMEENPKDIKLVFLDSKDKRNSEKQEPTYFITNLKNYRKNLQYYPEFPEN